MLIIPFGDYLMTFNPENVSTSSGDMLARGEGALNLCFHAVCSTLTKNELFNGA